MLKRATAQLTLVLEVRLEFAVQGLGVTAHLERKGSCFVVDVDFRNAIRSCGVDHELDLARAFHERVEIGSFIYGASNSLCMVSIVGGLHAECTYQQAMVSQDHAFAVRAQCSGQALSFFFTENDTTKVWVDGLCIAVEIADVLIDHVEFLCKCAPRLSSRAMAVAGSIDIGPRFVDGRMNEEASSVGRPAHVSANGIAIVVDKDHVGCLQSGKMLAERVCPESVRVLGITDGYVARHALSVPLPGKDPEGSSHVGEDPCALLVVGREEGNARKTDALRDGLQRRLVLQVLVSLHELLGVGSGRPRGGRDSRGGHVVDVSLGIDGLQVVVVKSGGRP
jgi:hypothetical protein